MKGSEAYASKLALGEAIEPGGFVGYGMLAIASNHAASQWRTAGTGYLGFQFTDQNGVAETGWAELTFSGEPSNDSTLDEYAYGTAGESLLAGKYPSRVRWPCWRRAGRFCSRGGSAGRLAYEGPPHSLVFLPVSKRCCAPEA